MSALLRPIRWWTACFGLALGLLLTGMVQAQQCQGPHCTLPCCQKTYHYWQHHMKPHGRTPTGPFCGTCCSCPPQGPFFGYFPTCWHRFPEGWENCPVTPWESGVRSPGPPRDEALYSPGGTPLDPRAGQVEEYAPVPIAPRVAPPVESVPEPAAPLQEAPSDSAPPAPDADGDAYHRNYNRSRQHVRTANPVQSHRTRAMTVSTAPAPQQPTLADQPTLAEPASTTPVAVVLSPATTFTKSELVESSKTAESEYSVPKPVLEVRRIPAVEEKERNVPVNSEELAPLPSVAQSATLPVVQPMNEPTPAVATATPEAPQVMTGKSHLANLIANPLRPMESTSRRVSGPNGDNPLR